MHAMGTHAHGQCALCHAQAIQAFVRQAMTYIDHTPDKETKVSLIKTLETVTEGKVSRVYVMGSRSAPVWSLWQQQASSEPLTSTATSRHST
jgi:hypothetical protein